MKANKSSILLQYDSYHKTDQGVIIYYRIENKYNFIKQRITIIQDPVLA